LHTFVPELLSEQFRRFKGKQMLTNELAVRRKITQLIAAQKKLKKSNLPTNATFGSLEFDALDLVEVILVVERYYKLVIPDEVPLNSINDFVDFICGQRLKQAS